jgi:hypothetical protein
VPIAFTLGPSAIIAMDLGQAFMSPVERNPSMQVALRQGLVDLQPSTLLATSCDSGNCKFQAASNITYSSLGFSSYCIDTTSFTNKTGPASWQDDATYDWRENVKGFRAGVVIAAKAAA